MKSSLKKAGLIARHVLRENRLCKRRVEELRSRERWEFDRMQLLQHELLHKTLLAASRRIPKYSRLRIPKCPSQAIAFLRDYCPVVTKAELVADRESFYPNGGRPYPWWISGKTSGTTGSPLEIFRSLNSVIWENAFVYRHWSWGGFEHGMRRATLRGDLVVGLDVAGPPYWLENRVDNQLLLSTRHLTKGNAGYFAEAIRSYQPFMLQAYPSAAFMLAEALAERNEKLNVPWVCTGSEILYPYQRDVIEARVGRVLDFYGMAERVAFAGECEFGNLHVNSDYSFVEILDEHGRPTDGDGFMVGTTFHNHLMPLLRYRLSDRTRWKPGVCQCGRPYPMIEPVQGKFEDVLYGSAANPVSPSIITFAFKGVQNIDVSQVAQVGEGAWEVRIVPGKGYQDCDGSQILKNIHALVDSNLSVGLVLKDSIPRTTSGKYRWVVNEWMSPKV